MSYKKINFENKPKKITPVSAENLNHMEDGIYDAHIELKKKANAIISTSTGKHIHENDCAAAPVINIGMQGNTEQPTTKGYQLFDISKVANTSDSSGASLTNNDNGSLTLSLMSTASIGNQTLSELAPNLVVGETYTLNAITTGEAKYIIVGETWVFGTSKTITEDMLNSIVRWYANGNMEKATVTISDIIIYKDGDGTLEQYTGGQASPNMEYNQDITHAGTYNEETGRYEHNLYITPKNVIGYPYVTESGSVKTGVTCSYEEDGIILLNGTSTANSEFDLWKGTLPKDVFTLSWTQSSANTRIYLRKDGELITSRASTDKAYSFEAEENSEYTISVLTLKNYDFSNVSVKVQLESGSEATEISPPSVIQIGTLTSERPITKWDTLMEQDEQIGWGYKGLKMVVDGTETWYSYAVHKGFLLNCEQYGLPSSLNVEGFCNQLLVARASADNVPTIWIGQGNAYIYCINNPFFNNSLEDYGLANFKAHLNEHPLEIWTYTDDIEFVPLLEEEQETIRNLMMYYGVTNVWNDQSMQMQVTHVKDTQKHIEQNYVPVTEFEELKSMVSEIQQVLVNL